MAADRRYVVEWREIVNSPMDGERPLTLCEMASTPVGAKAICIKALRTALDGEVRIRSVGEPAIRRDPNVCGEREIAAWKPHSETMPARKRDSGWAAALAREHAVSMSLAAFRDAAEQAVHRRLLDPAAAARLVEAVELALEGGGPIVSGWA